MSAGAPPADGNSSFTFEALDIERELDLLHFWRNEPHIAATWGGASDLEKVREDFMNDETDSSADMHRYIVFHNGEALAYLQSYRAAKCSDGWWPEEKDPGTIGIDFFIGPANKIGQGLGSAMLRAAVSFLFSDLTVSNIMSDPSPDNERSVKCLERAGFVGEGLVDTPDGKANLMRISRQ